MTCVKSVCYIIGCLREFIDKEDEAEHIRSDTVVPAVDFHTLLLMKSLPSHLSASGGEKEHC